MFRRLLCIGLLFTAQSVQADVLSELQHSLSPSDIQSLEEAQRALENFEALEIAPMVDPGQATIQRLGSAPELCEAFPELPGCAGSPDPDSQDDNFIINGIRR